MLNLLSLLLLSMAPLVTEEPRPVVIGQSFTFHSELLGEERTIQVHLPQDYVWSEASYPVVYLLDGETNFHHTTGTLDTLSRLGHVPDFIVVAVNNTDRVRDLSPRRLSAIPTDGEDKFPKSGGAADLSTFCRTSSFHMSMRPIEQRRTAFLSVIPWEDSSPYTLSSTEPICSMRTSR